MAVIAARHAAKLHVEEIRSNKFAIGKKEPNPLTQDLHHAVSSLSAKFYTKGVHFFNGNAEDNEYPIDVQPTPEFVLTTRVITRTGARSTLLVFNNEVGFSRKNMDSICSVGRSTKKGKRHLGFTGEKDNELSFVSKQPHIFSNRGIGYIVPEWVEGTTIILPSTIIVLPLKPEKVEATKAQLSELHPEFLLFLCKIKRLSVRLTMFQQYSETDQNTLPSDRASSCVVHPSAKENLETTEETCRYFMWRQVKVSSRNDIDEWIISLAFPFGKRLKRGTSSFADCILASSRETILLDNKRNMEILGCVPSAFFNAFSFCVKKGSSSFPETRVFEFLPAQASSITELNNTKESIKIMVQKARIIPCEMFSGTKHFCKPDSVIRIHGGFQDLLNKTREFCMKIVEGIPLKGLFLLRKVLMHASLDLEICSNVLDYLGVTTASESNGWYAQCTQSCNFILQASHDAYGNLLYFISQIKLTSLTSNFKLSYMKYVTMKGEVKLCDPPSRNTLYAAVDDHHEWLVKWNKQTFISHVYSTVYQYPRDFILCKIMSIVDGFGSLRKQMLETLVPTNRSKWATLFGPINPFLEQHYIDIGESYLIDFLVKHCRAKGLLELPPPNMVSCLTIQQGLSIPEKRWIKNYLGFSCLNQSILLDTLGTIIFDMIEASLTSRSLNNEQIDLLLMFININKEKNMFDRDGWMLLETINGYELSQCYNARKESLYLQLEIKVEAIMEIINLLPVDESFYGSKPSSFSIELNMLGVMFNMKQLLVKSELLKTSHHYKAPNKLILFSSKWATIMTFFYLHFIDDFFYGLDIYVYKDELKVLGAIIDFSGAIFVVRGLKQEIKTYLITWDSAISLLDCIKSLISECNDEYMFVDFLNNLSRSKWLKTKFGYRNPEQCILFDPAWEGILQRTDVPCIEERHYDTDSLVYKDQLRALGVKVDHEVSSEGKWISSLLCMLYDKYKLFGARMYVLEDYYIKELLPMFTSIFGVAKFPSINDYLQLWNDWVSQTNDQVTALECFSFWVYVVDNWNPFTMKTLKENMTKLPATNSSTGEIYLVNKEEVFLPDDLQLKMIFENVEVPLFAWLPRQCNLSPWFS
ncbi:hypothetical protein GOBAR_DD16901 [Gossypium barbadense]|nr:hypothetical protein GOBAR_DD16901 [Gossypium barbadense]